MEKHIILTGTPGAGKTTLINLLKKEGFAIVEEAAIQIINQHQKQGILKPWKKLSFIEDILKHQQKQKEKVENEKLVFFDRFPICTNALCKFLNFSIPQKLLEEIENIQKYKAYWKKALFIKSLGFIENITARKITYEQALILNKCTYKPINNLGFHSIL